MRHSRGVEAINDEFGQAGKKLAEMLKENRLQFFYAQYKIYRKVFVLEGGGRQRVIIGFTNMSSAAFSGLQGRFMSK